MTLDVMMESPLVGDVAGNLRVLVGRLLRALQAQDPEDGLSMSKVSVLSRLADDGPASASTLASAERVRPQSMSATLAALEAEGLVARRPHPTDRRQILIELTEQGWQTARSARRSREDWLTRVLESEYDQEELRLLSRAIELLERLAER
ncbi:MarR family winged helix-turn-helix transcriptional regulator [Gandjariella thermophila]|uniref:MarR family transcriptional regulator n=1 Tax=Gandjariella thermophila TaxID=1931992 RepID=A0A4D4JE93_9PSEU|nr:MarR family transcriptional regulator [Gandjariella thermophila]GDY33732.1 MarR family transcriptional regulator [Gandjariella thermophila]